MKNKIISSVALVLALLICLTTIVFAEPDASISVSFDKETYTVKIGSSLKVAATVSDTSVTLTYKITENEKVASVDSEGNVTGKKEGTAKIGAFVGDVEYATAYIKVEKAKLSVVEGDGASYLRGFDVGSTIDTCQGDIAEYLGVEKILVNIYKTDESLAATNDIIATGMSIEVGGEKYSAIIMGDVNGDGVIDYTDTAAAVKYLSGEEYVSNPVFRDAAIVTGSELDIECVLLISRHIENRSKISQS